jgi:HEXXH motif-containing protein
MRLPRARSLSDLSDLTLPGAGSTTVRALLSAALGEAMQIAASLDVGRASKAFRRAALSALSADRALFAASMRQTSRFTLARCLAHAGDATAEARAAWADELSALLTIDVAEHGALASPVDLEAPPALLVRERAAIAYRVSADRLRVSSTGLSFARGERVADVPFSLDAAAAARALAPLGGTAEVSSAPLFEDESRLVLADNNPLSTLEAHPEKTGSVADLGGREPSAWAASLREARAIVDRHLPEIADEMRLLLRHVVPVGWDEHKHLSASYLEAAGVVYLSLHPHVMTLAEALVHEFQHNKLNLALGFDPLVENGFSPLFTSPVRPDPRPLRGVLLAVHAFQPIAVLYDRMLVSAEGPERAWLERRRDEIVALCHEGCEILLPNARPTPLGATLLAETRRLDARA